jgi:hypothetical protein
MILCCDVINLVRRASKDLKLAKQLKMKRSETCRATQNGRYTVVNHQREDQQQTIASGGSPHRRDFSYERDTVNKVVKLSEFDE